MNYTMIPVCGKLETMKKVLFITHQLTRTGAPIVMMDAVRVVRNAGCEVHMISMDEGELRSDVEALGIDITIRSDFMEDWKSFLTPIWNYDLVFVNTIVPLQTIHLLNLAHMPVIWWIHEPEIYFDVYGQWLPDFTQLKPHIHVWAVSPLVQEVIQRRFGYEAELVPFGIEDAAESLPGREPDTVIARSLGDYGIGSGQTKSDTKLRFIEENVPGLTYHAGKSEAPIPSKDAIKPGTARVTFLTIGVYCKRKGQDLLQKAIESLPRDLNAKCRFLFCGNQTDTEPEVYLPLKKFAAQAENVELLPEMPHDKMLRVIKDADYLLIPSRQEPMPTVAAEAMMLSVPSVISNACGIAQYLEHRENGLIFRSDDVTALCEEIREAVMLRLKKEPSYLGLCRKAREIYEKCFTPEIFREKLLSVFSSVDG